MTRVERSSPCKVNLLLNILGKRPDGFHELETVMHPIQICDTLSFERTSGSGVELTSNNPDLPVDETNLVYKAALAYLRAGAAGEGVRIHLEKRIPLAAGLGGGSGNAATTLLGLNELFGQQLPPEAIESAAATLGSDVPFFLQAKPALATGRGEQVASLDFFPALRSVFVLLIHPGFGVSTPWAYQALADFPRFLNGQRGRAANLSAALQDSTLEEAAALLFNSLEAPVLRKHPILRLYQEFLRDHGAVAALMSGSGSTTFGLFKSDTKANEAAAAFVEKFGARCWTAVAPL